MEFISRNCVMYILSVSVVIKTYSTHPVSVTRPLLIRGTADLRVKEYEEGYEEGEE